MRLTAIQGWTPAILLPLLQRTALCTAVRSGSRLSMEQSTKTGEAIVPRDGGHALSRDSRRKAVQRMFGSSSLCSAWRPPTAPTASCGLGTRTHRTGWTGWRAQPRRGTFGRCPRQGATVTQTCLQNSTPDGLRGNRVWRIRWK